MKMKHTGTPVLPIAATIYIISYFVNKLNGNSTEINFVRALFKKLIKW